MSEQTATPGTPTTPTEGASNAAAAAASLLTSTEDAATTPEQQAAAAAAAAAATDPAKAAADAAAAKAAEDATKAAEQAKPAGAPEKYEFKAPEGKEYDAVVLEPFSEAAKAANLSQDAAQKILETMAPKLVERQQAQVEAIQTGWRDAAKVDPEFGGDKLQENLAFAKKALDAFAPNGKDGTVSGFRKLLDDSGLGNHPEVIRVLVRAGKAIGEDGFVAGTGKPGSSQDLAAKLYPNTPAKT